jgi:hypothetical protein
MSLSRTLSADAVAFNLYLVFQAVNVKLYEAAIEEIERQDLPFTALDANMEQLTANALKIATVVRSNWGHQRFSVSPPLYSFCLGHPFY